jgi:hypothetical protein
MDRSLHGLTGAAEWLSLRSMRRVSDAKRDRVYCAGAILDILEEPAHLIPSNPHFE